LVYGNGLRNCWALGETIGQAFIIGKNNMISKPQLVQLTHEAKRHGATSSAVISSKEIQVKEHLAALCNGEYTCPNYGLAASCPPHVEGPVEFRKWQAKSKYSIAVKIELPTSVLFSDECKGVMLLLHHIVSAVEQKAIEIGFKVDPNAWTA
jgi:predicted metal-binding protein